MADKITVEFMSPRLRGKRFEMGTIPLEVLKDLAVLEELVTEVAKRKFLNDNRDRKRSPKGFTKGITLTVASIGEGSAVPKIQLEVTSAERPGMMPPLNQHYFELARDEIVDVIAAADIDNQQAVSKFPKDALAYFDRFGRSLRDDESIEFTTPKRTEPARLTRESRHRLVLASSVKEFTEEIELRGTIPEADQDKESFEMQLIDGHKVKAPLTDQHRSTVLKAFNGYPQGEKVLLHGIVKYDRKNRLVSIESIDHVSELDPLDVPARLDELRSLKDGWLDGTGTAPSREGLNWLAAEFDSQFPEELPLPHIYPTADGGVEAEWSIGNFEASLSIDLTTRLGDWHLLEIDGREESEVFDLTDFEGWARLVANLSALPGNGNG